MRRLGRWTFNTVTAVSLVLSLALAAMWARSYWVVDYFSTVSQSRRLELQSRCGLIQTEDWRVVRALQYEVRSDRCWKSYRPADPGFGDFPWDGPALTTLGFSHRRKLHGSPPVFDVRQLRLPYWAVFGMAFCMTAGCFKVLLTHRKRARRLAAGLCPTCAYDLRASVNRCPECGTLAQRTTPP